MGFKRFTWTILLLLPVLIITVLSLNADAQHPIETVTVNTPTQINADINFNVNASGIPINDHLLGTNHPAWIGPSLTENNTFIERTKTLNAPLLRIPGGSWSNEYNWLACEMEDNSNCWHSGWAASPSDFINFLQATDAEAMYTVNLNGTAKEAAALVAFFNGSVNDDRAIGLDVNGQDWGVVSDWAKLRRDHGNPEPYYVKYWEVGNEIYGGREGNGKDCLSWGWEPVWTCDGTEYVNGLGNHEGFIAFRNAMRAVDPSIMVGAVGITYGNSPDWWVNYNDWGNEVIAAAGQEMDFYVVHQYAFNEPPNTYQDVLAEPQGSWQAIKDDIEASFEQYANGRDVPIAVTEYNLFAMEYQDTDEWMSQAVNGLFLADTIGQMMLHEFDIANQWDIAHGDDNIPSRYGLMRANNLFRSPQYYVFPLWSQFGSEMLPVESAHNAATELSVYAGRIDPWTVSVMAINKTGNQIATSIGLDGAPEMLIGGTADVVQAPSLSSTSVSFNGSYDPNDSLSDAPPTNLGIVSNPMVYTFEPYSITLLRIAVAEFEPTDWVYLPSVLR